jgi:hypothetical protein
MFELYHVLLAPVLPPGNNCPYRDTAIENQKRMDLNEKAVISGQWLWIYPAIISSIPFLPDRLHNKEFPPETAVSASLNCARILLALFPAVISTGWPRSRAIMAKDKPVSLNDDRPISKIKTCCVAQN